MINLNKLTKYYIKGNRGIEDIDLIVNKGEVFGFIGPNGAGKSTTVRTLINLIYPTSGSASLMGLDIIEDSIEIRKNIGYIPSEVNYYNDMKVSSFLNYSTKFYSNNYNDRINYLSEKLELDLNSKIGDLSFGNKKKIAIVAAFVHKPEILLLDEPTSGLDPLISNVFFELLEEERKRGATIFFSSHILADVQRVCDRVGVIKEGRLIKVQSVDEIMKAQVKHIKLTSLTNIDLRESESIIDLNKIHNTYSFIYKGNINSLLKMLSRYDIDNLLITEPSLEEVFMHFYKRSDIK